MAGLAGALARAGDRVDVLTMAWGPRRPRDCPDGVRLIEVPCVRRRVSRTAAWELLAYVPVLAAWVLAAVLRRRYDVCHVHFIMPGGIAAWLLRALIGQRFLVTAHGSDVPGYNHERFVKLHHALVPIWHRIVGAADTIVCPSPTMDRLVREAVPNASTTVIPNGFDEARFSPDRPRRRRVLVVSRLFRRKGVRTVVDAFLGLDTSFELHIVGDGPELEGLHAYTDGRDDIVMHGWIDNDDPRLRELYETSAIFAFVSKAENFPVCLLEAMAAGLAIVTSAGTGCADVVGDAALLVKPGDVDGLRAALEKLMGDPEEVHRLRRAGRLRLEQRLTWRKVAADHARLYRTLLPPEPVPVPVPAGLAADPVVRPGVDL